MKCAIARENSLKSEANRFYDVYDTFTTTKNQNSNLLHYLVESRTVNVMMSNGYRIMNDDDHHDHYDHVPHPLHLMLSFSLSVSKPDTRRRTAVMNLWRRSTTKIITTTTMVVELKVPEVELEMERGIYLENISIWFICDYHCCYHCSLAGG